MRLSAFRRPHVDDPRGTKPSIEFVALPLAAVRERLAARSDAPAYPTMTLDLDELKYELRCGYVGHGVARGRIYEVKTPRGSAVALISPELHEALEKGASPLPPVTLDTE